VTRASASNGKARRHSATEETETASILPIVSSPCFFYTS
jgi:hypothetical protein